jgi:hypothetical protein
MAGRVRNRPRRLSGLILARFPAGRRNGSSQWHSRSYGALKEATARLVSQLNLEPVILHEQPRQGRATIDNLARYTLKVSIDMGPAPGIKPGCT